MNEEFFFLKKKMLFSMNFNFVYNWFLAEITLTKLSVSKILKSSINQTEYSRLEESAVIKCLLAEKSNPCDIYSIMFEVNQGAFFSHIFTNGRNLGLLQRN